MAKKNSTKTATKEALSASEPRVIAFRQWQGINIKEAPNGWTPLDPHHQQTDLSDNFLMLQNNVVTTSSQALETRLDTRPICYPPDGYKFTGVVCLMEKTLLAAVTDGNEEHDEEIYYRSVTDDPNDNTWKKVVVVDADRKEGNVLRFTSINYYQEQLIVFTKDAEDEDKPSEIFTGAIKTMDTIGIKSAKSVPDPTGKTATLKAMGSLKEVGEDEYVSRIEICFCWINKFGPTLPSDVSTIYVDDGAEAFHASKYLKISGAAPTGYDITGVDIFCVINDSSQGWAFIGHVDFPKGNGGSWTFNWLGALTDTTQWTNSNTTLPTANYTKGVDAQYMNVHDGRLYFMGGSEKHRLYIGGNPGNELSVSTGTGGAFVDVEPGTGLVINNTHKFKTYNGASIVTLMCGNVNTHNVKRFNLLDTNLSVTNENQFKSYMTEEVSNVVGCNSHFGSGVFADGLYAVSRYGLAVTTQAMESNNQLRAQLVSDPIQPVFTDRVSELLSDARILSIDGVIYLIFSVPDSDNDDELNINKHTGLDRVIMCYDIDKKAWYTMTYEDTEGLKEEIEHIFQIDYQGFVEGLGLVSPSVIDLIPMTGPRSEEPPEFTALIETGELGIRLPPQLYCWLEQIELRFDYIVGDLEVEIYGRDYYGRDYKVYKKITTKDKDGKYKLIRNRAEWIRCQRLVETYSMRIKGKAHFRMTHFLSKTYQQSQRIGLVYGFDSLSDYQGRHGKLVEEHHYLDSYNNLRNAIVT